MYVEDDFHELKENAGGNLSETAAAFANTEGGEIVIGVRKEGSIVGISDKELDMVEQKIENSIRAVSPIPTHSIERKVEEGKNILVVRISKLEGICTYKGIVYYRHGSVTNKLDGGQLREFLASRNMLYFDGQVCENATIEDIDKGKLEKFMERRSNQREVLSRNMEGVLLNLGVARMRQGRFQLTNAALLFFGKDPFAFFKQNEIRLASFSGHDASSEILDKADFHMAILENVEEAMKFIKKNTRSMYEVKGLQRIEVPEYPERVIREAIVNAVAHRDYFSADAIQIRIFSNRVEFINPGKPPEGIDIGKMDSGISVKRNPLIYQLMRDMRYMEGMATGIPMIKKLMSEAGMPPPEYSISGPFLILTLYNKLGKRLDLSTLNERQRRGIEEIRRKGRITAKEYAKINLVSIPTAISDIAGMVDAGLLKRIGKTRGSFYIINEA